MVDKRFKREFVDAPMAYARRFGSACFGKRYEATVGGKLLDVT